MPAPEAPVEAPARIIASAPVLLAAAPASPDAEVEAGNEEEQQQEEQQQQQQEVQRLATAPVPPPPIPTTNTILQPLIFIVVCKNCGVPNKCTIRKYNNTYNFNFKF